MKSAYLPQALSRLLFMSLLIVAFAACSKHDDDVCGPKEDEPQQEATTKSMTLPGYGHDGSSKDGGFGPGVTFRDPEQGEDDSTDDDISDDGDDEADGEGSNKKGRSPQ